MILLRVNFINILRAPFAPKKHDYVALGSVPSSQTSFYRSPQWVRQSGQLQSLPVSLYRSLLQVPSLPISHYRSLLIRKMEKMTMQSSVFQPFTSHGTFRKLLSVWRNLDTQNITNLRILREPSQELAEPWLKNTDVEKSCAKHFRTKNLRLKC